MKHQYSRWREHGAPGWLLVFTVAGRGRFGHAQGEKIVGSGDLIMIRPGILNDYGLEPELRRWDLLWAYFFPPIDWQVFLQWPEIAPGLMHLHIAETPRRQELRRQLMEVNRLNNGPLQSHELFAMNALERCLLECNEANPQSRQARFDPRIRRALDYLCENVSAPVALPELARHCGLSLSRLAHLFRDQVGQTPQRFFELTRLTRACRLLELTQEPIESIAASVGFQDPFHFSHRFKRHIGVSPRAYRARLAAGQRAPWQYTVDGPILS